MKTHVSSEDSEEASLNFHFFRIFKNFKACYALLNTAFQNQKKIIIIRNHWNRFYVYLNYYFFFFNIFFFLKFQIFVTFDLFWYCSNVCLEICNATGWYLFKINCTPTNSSAQPSTKNATNNSSKKHR